MTFSDLKELIKMERFIAKYCPSISNAKHKLRGVDGNKKPITFNELEKKQIKKAIAKFAEQIRKVIVLLVI
jgi:hypothetical protein